MVASLINNQPLEKIEYYILGNKKPVKTEDTIEWAKWFEKEENWCVAKDIINDNQIITIFHGMDVSLTGNPPILFRTMVICGELDGETDCYSTWQGAEAGHKKMVEKVKSNQ